MIFMDTIKNRCQVTYFYRDGNLFLPSEQNSQKWLIWGDGNLFLPSRPILTVTYFYRIYIYAIGSCKALVINEREIRLITAESKRVNEGNNAPDNKGRHAGQIVHVLPQEKLYIDVIIDVFGLVEKC